MAAQCATDIDDNPLWNFALQFYASKDAQQQLLSLQNDHQQDTLLMLTALWLADNSHAWQLSEQQLQPYCQWREQVIWRLRTTRKAIAKEHTSTAVSALRQQIQRDEIRAEQIALSQLYQLSPLPMQSQTTEQQATDKTDLACSNLLAQSQIAGEIADIKKETLRSLFQTLAGLLAKQADN